MLDQRSGDYQPFAVRMHPDNSDEYIGQCHFVGESWPLRPMVEICCCHAFIFWGPLVAGKMTIAFRTVTFSCMMTQCIDMSAVMPGLKEIRAAVKQAQ